MENNIFQNKIDAVEIHRHISEKLSRAYGDHSVGIAHAWWLLETTLQTTRSSILLNKFILNDEQSTWLSHAVHRIVTENMPIQYIIGSVQFINLIIHVAPPILIPRNETEAWVEQLITDYRTSLLTPHHILDLCTGSGCIAIALAHTFPQATIDAVDRDERAVALCQKNIQINQLNNITTMLGNLFAPLPSHKKYDLIVANPPYIPQAAYEKLDASVYRWEASHALTAGEDDIAIIKRIIQEAPTWLYDNGRLIIEIDATQGTRVMNLFHEHQFSDIHILRDYCHHDRVVTGIYRKKNHGTSS